MARRQVVVSSDTAYITRRHTHRNVVTNHRSRAKGQVSAQVVSPRSPLRVPRNAPKKLSSLSPLLLSLFHLLMRRRKICTLHFVCCDCYKARGVCVFCRCRNVGVGKQWPWKEHVFVCLREGKIRELREAL